MGKKGWIVGTGAMWLLVGVGLLVQGVRFVAVKGEAALPLVAIGLLVGLFKGRVVLAKTVRRVVERIWALTYPIRLSQVYSGRYLCLVGGMMMLGFSLRWWPIPLEVRGVIDLAVGSALVNGAFVYFRLALVGQVEGR